MNECKRCGDQFDPGQYFWQRFCCAQCRIDWHAARAKLAREMLKRAEAEIRCDGVGGEAA